MIINNKYDVVSQAFVDANPGYRVVDWYDSESEDKLVCDLLNINAISSFPSVADTTTKKITVNPATMAEALTILNGLDEASIKETRRDQIDAKTDTLIEAGVTHVIDTVSIVFTLSIEDQTNINGMYVNRTSLTYPVTVKGKVAGVDTYGQLDNADEVTAFYQACFASVQTKLAAGWTLKDSLNSMTYQQLLDFVDPR